MVLFWGPLFMETTRRVETAPGLGEYGADAYNSKISGEDRESQARATRELTATQPPYCRGLGSYQEYGPVLVIQL